MKVECCSCQTCGRCLCDGLSRSNSAPRANLCYMCFNRAFLPKRFLKPNVLFWQLSYGKKIYEFSENELLAIWKSRILETTPKHVLLQYGKKILPFKTELCLHFKNKWECTYQLVLMLSYVRDVGAAIIDAVRSFHFSHTIEIFVIGAFIGCTTQSAFWSQTCYFHNFLATGNYSKTFLKLSCLKFGNLES